ncbi:CpmK protein [Erwinia sp. 198]|uniref:CpmK protein n=1 Tax=Erwinia sp. 198 TaxID=2022746 RepID=UPI000F66A85F|nr:CpmK protein [Erwinia sp. 198]RRZ92221.1 CpmK protein [Erwinia sp. 198]
MKAIIMLAAALFTVSCHAGSDGVNDKNYKAAIQQALDLQPPLCLGEKTWPAVTNTQGYSWINAKMEALKEAGLITKKSAGGKIDWRLTTYGQKAFNQSGDFCYGNFKVSKITDLNHHDDGTVAVDFTYKITALPAWAKNKAVRVAYTDLDNDLMGIGHARYEIIFRKERSGKLVVLSPPSQLDLLY